MVAHVEQLFAKASECHEARLWSEAEALYRSVLDQEPGHAVSLQRLGLLAYQNGRHDDAISLLQRAISLQPDNGEFHSSVGAVFLAAGRQSEALAPFERAVSLDPGSAAHRNNLAYVLNALGFFAKAVSEYEQALKITPDNSQIRNNFAQVLAAQGEVDLAIENFRKGIASAPNNAEIYANLGSALCAKGMFDDAIEACTNALKINPHLVLAHYSIGKALAGLKRFSEAVEAYGRAAAIVPNAADIHKNLGIAHHRTGAWEAARASFETASRNASNDRQLAEMADAYGALSQMQSGMQAFYRILQASPTFDSLNTIGDALNASGFHSLGLETIFKGPGLIWMSLATPPAPATPAAQRIDLSRPSTTNFVGCWMMPNPEICDRLVSFFEANTALQAPGKSAAGLNSAVKRSTDIPIALTELDKPEYGPLSEYLRDLESCLQDYGRQWPHLSEMLPRAEMGPFNLQRYQVGGHFQVCHNERMDFRHIHRVLAWMTYLNDVEAGGETSFPHLGLAVKPQRGKTLIWPAEWTHAHRGEAVIAGTKYIVTGWFHFPHPQEPNLLSAIIR